MDDEERTDVPYEFGGDDWIRHRASMQRIWEEIAPGDIVLSYQTNNREILGLTRLHSCGREDEAASGRFNVFDLVPADQAFVFDTPIRVVEDLYENGIHPTCFAQGSHGTLFAVSATDFAAMMEVHMRSSPGQEQALQRWLAQPVGRISPPA